jgi:hypothetical protein
MDKPKLQRKIFDIAECKAYQEGDNVIIEGYANTKGHPDRDGDIPTVMNSLRNYVYELKDYLKNPVMLIDHENSVDHIAGSFLIVREDEKGLFVRGMFSNSDFPLIKHARTVYLEGHAKAFSIGGYWYFEDEANPKALTYAVICDISLVGVGADQDALGSTFEKALRSLEYAKALMPGLTESQVIELKSKGLHFCGANGICRKLQEDITNGQLKNVSDVLGKINISAAIILENLAQRGK